MKNMKFWRTALVATLVLTVMLSVTGGTIAWFTDEVTSGQNKIQAGTLDIQLFQMDKNGNWNDISESKAALFDYDKWEPGYTTYQVLKVVNNGTLALKWKAHFASENEVGMLADAIDVYVNTAEPTSVPADRETVEGWTKEATLTQFINNLESVTVGELAPQAEAYLSIGLKMRESAGNEYQGKTLGAFDVRILATQLTAEEDAFDDQYDADAEYEISVSDANELAAVLARGGKVKLANNIVLTESLTVANGKTATIDMNGKEISAALTKADGALIVNNGNLVIEGDANSVIKNTAINGSSVIQNNGVMVINGGNYEGAPSDTATGTASYAVNTAGSGAVLTVNNANISGRGTIGNTKGSKTVVNGGTYHTPAVAWGHAIYVVDEGSEVVINGGTFSEGYEMTSNNYGMYQIYSGNNAKVTVNGGTFMAWDCANGYDLCTATGGVIEIRGGTFAEDPSSQNGVNYVATGYNVTNNGDGTWTVSRNS